jgi:sodium-dependent phosphate cotransporter
MVVSFVNAELLSLTEAISVIMGANIGTTVTNTLVSLGHVRQSVEFKRAFAAATVHDFFNLLAVAILLPVEIYTHLISKIAQAISDLLVGGGGGTDWESPVKAWVKGPVKLLKSMWEQVGLSDTLRGTLMVLTGLAIILVALAFITKNMRTLVADRVERSVNAVLGKGGGAIAMLLGLIITVAVQSSSITTSILIPLSAAGVLSLRNAYPVTLGANVGTTITALLAAMAASNPDSLTVGLAHTTFNVAGIFLLYVIPIARDVPIMAAEKLADLAVERKIWAVAYVVVLFIVLPLLGVTFLR